MTWPTQQNLGYFQRLVLKLEETLDGPPCNMPVQVMTSRPRLVPSCVGAKSMDAIGAAPV